MKTDLSDYFRTLQAKSARKRWSGKTKEERSQAMKDVALAKKRKKSLAEHLTT